MANSKEKWSAPVLLVIARNKPEEQVLATCKVAGKFGPYSQGQPIHGCGRETGTNKCWGFEGS